MNIRFFVPGKPRGLKRHRDFTLPNGARVHTDPSKADKADFLAMAMEHRPDEPWQEPVCLELVCVFPRPKSHFRTGKYAHLLKDGAPYWYSSTPDADNLLKFVGDSLNGIYWRDDRIIIPTGVYRIYGKTPGVLVHIYPPTSFESQHVNMALTGD